MKREEKRRRFHDALLNMLYPPPPSPPRTPHDDMVPTCRQNLHVDAITDGLGEDKSPSSSSDYEEDDESGLRKLTRAQRKRIRKKKLKQAATSRRKIIGPLLPTTVDDDADGEAGEEVEDCSLQVARENATKKADTAAQPSETAASSSKQSKLRCRRRMAKKLGGQSSKSTSKENASQGQLVTRDKNEN